MGLFRLLYYQSKTMDYLGLFFIVNYHTFNIKFDPHENGYHLIFPQLPGSWKKTHGINHLQTVKLFKTNKGSKNSIHDLSSFTIKKINSSPMDPMGKGEILYLVDFYGKMRR